MKSTNDLILHLLKKEFERNELTLGDKNSGDDIWIMAVSSTPYQTKEESPSIPINRLPIHKVRVILRTNDCHQGINPYVDGTDLYVSIDTEQQSTHFVLEEVWAEGPPIFEGGDILSAMHWINEVTEPFYIQYEDPFLAP